VVTVALCAGKIWKFL